MERPVQKRLACVFCTRAKRKCDKRTPSCTRCMRKKFTCRYPAPRMAPLYDILYAEDGAMSAVPVVTCGASEMDPQASRERREPVQESPHDRLHSESSQPSPGGFLSRPDPTGIGPSFDSQCDTPWFLTPSSWELAHAPRSECLTFGEDSLMCFVNTLQDWLRQWTSQGHCAFIHRRLYPADLPLSIQDAYTTLTAYQTKTPKTERMILRIVKNRVSNLVQSQPLEPVDGIGTVMLDTTKHLARTQALIIYTTICLFDGDINARAQAEQGLEVLLPWAYQLLQSASLDTYCQAAWGISQPDEGHRGGVTSDGMTGPVTSNQLALGTDGDLESVWGAWVFAESIRRTYLIVVLLVTVYPTLKEGWSGCPGGVNFTGDKGLWDASSPYVWGKILETAQEKGMGLAPIRSHRLGDVLGDRKPGDLDDFTHALLIVTMGLELVERWTAGRGLEVSVQH